MLVTPPDAISQTMLAVPVYLLYETGLFMARVFDPSKASSDEADVQVGTEGGGE